jgi:hypothetical protein
LTICTHLGAQHFHAHAPEREYEALKTASQPHGRASDSRVILRLFAAGLFGQSAITLQPDILDVIKGKADVRHHHLRLPIYPSIITKFHRRERVENLGVAASVPDGAPSTFATFPPVSQRKTQGEFCLSRLTCPIISDHSTVDSSSVECWRPVFGGVRPLYYDEHGIASLEGATNHPLVKEVTFIHQETLSPFRLCVSPGLRTKVFSMTCLVKGEEGGGGSASISRLLRAPLGQHSHAMFETCNSPGPSSC